MTIEFHSLELTADSATNVITVRVTGKLTKEVYAEFRFIRLMRIQFDGWPGF